MYIQPIQLIWDIENYSFSFLLLLFRINEYELMFFNVDINNLYIKFVLSLFFGLTIRVYKNKKYVSFVILRREKNIYVYKRVFKG